MKWYNKFLISLMVVIIIIALVLREFRPTSKQLADSFNGLVILSHDITFDGVNAPVLPSYAGSVYTSRCYLELSDGQHIIPYMHKNFGATYVYAVKSGTLSYNQLECNNFFGRRVFRFPEPLTVDVRPGEIVYPGTVVVEWSIEPRASFVELSSEPYAPSDLIGSGLYKQNDGLIHIKLRDDSSATEEALNMEAADVLNHFTFVVRPFTGIEAFRKINK